MDCCKVTCATLSCKTSPFIDWVFAIREALEAKHRITLANDKLPRHPSSKAMLINIVTTGRPLFTEIAPFKFPKRLIILNVNREFLNLKLKFVFTSIINVFGLLKLRFLHFLDEGRRCPVRVRREVH
jgi:hypothetical protein